MKLFPRIHPPSAAWPAAIGLALTAALLRGDDWPQWRGPQRNGHSHETGLLKEWPKEGPKLVWQVKEIGAGYSAPAIAANRIYLLANDGLTNEFVQALDIQNGKRIWSTRLGNVGNPEQKPTYPAARSTAAVDGELLYALGSDGDLVCLETAGGKVRWQKNLRTDFGGKPHIWAYSESPLIDGEKVICTPGGADATLVALNKKTGETIWKTPLPGGSEAAYSSAIVMETGGVKQYAQMLVKGLVGVAADTGKILWQYDRTAKNCPAVIPTPVADGNFIYSSGARVGGGLIQLKVIDGVAGMEPVYFASKLPKDIGGSVKVGDYLYGTSEPVLLCVEFATGKIKWDDRNIGASSICYAEDRLYLHGENGEVLLVEATPEGFREKGHFSPPDQPNRGNQKAWAYPAIANGRLYLRDLGSLWCYDIKAN
jgi:outer membrane protein assembly factor BamB